MSTHHSPASNIFLASSSQRRRELLAQVGVSFDVLLFRHSGTRDNDDDLDETPQTEEPVEQYVERVARNKAAAGIKRVAWRQLPLRPVLAADTVIDLDGEIIGKPTSFHDAIDTLKRLSGRSHRVLTAIALGEDEQLHSVLSINEVTFRDLDDDEIHHYVSTGESLDKAGAYGIQGYAATFIKHIQGSYSGIMGLPLYETAMLMKKLGYTLRP